MPKVKGQKSSKVMLSKKEAKAVRGLIEGETQEVGPVLSVAAGAGSVDWDETITVQSPLSWGNVAGDKPFVDGFGITFVTASGLAMDVDRIQWKFITFRGHHLLEPVAPAAGQTPVVVRTVVVWFYKPRAVLSNGSLPPASEVFSIPYYGASIGVDSPYVDQSDNAGRFVVLSDKTWNLGMSTIDAVAGGCQSGKNRCDFEYKVMVNKLSHGGEQANGTYLYSPYVVTRGFPMVYTFSAGDGGTLRSLTVCKATIIS